MNSDWHKSTRLQETESEETIIRKANKEGNNDTDSEESYEENEEETENTPKISKKSGRPKLLKTGKKGRPRKLYQGMIREEETLHR